MKTSVLPESYRRLLTPEQRRELRQPTIEESKAKGDMRIEKDLQRLIYLELTRRGLFFHYSRMDKKTRSGKGTPDFALPIKGCYFAFEIKSPTGKQSEAQSEVETKIKNQEARYFVIRSFDQFIAILEQYL